MSDLSVKKNVRERDNFKCRKCGINQNNHREETSRDLDVHRLIPGMLYHEDWCVTLCRECHGQMPRDCEALVFGNCEDTGIFLVYFNLFHPEDCALYERLKADATRNQIEAEAIVKKLLFRHYGLDSPDYCI